MSGTQVAGFMSCSRIFQFKKDLPSSADAPFRPSSCRTPPEPSFTSALVSAARRSFMEMRSARNAGDAPWLSAGRAARPTVACRPAQGAASTSDSASARRVEEGLIAEHPEFGNLFWEGRLNL
eukprot:scaffold1246_cov117-Isochrysis_galbana.AAC.4